jgi:hypothetical protein
MKSSIWLLMATLVGFIAAGIPFWTAPYNKQNLQHLAIGLIVVGVCALLVSATASARFWKTVCFLGLTVPAANCSRIAADVMRDPTSHNLWPLELIIAVVVGFGTALIGAAAGIVIRRIAEWLGGRDKSRL